MKPDPSAQLPTCGTRHATLIDRRDPTRRHHCTLVWNRTRAARTLALMLLDGTTIRVDSNVDFEDALGGLRRALDERDLLLACNRFRRDAVTTDELRSATDGLYCSLVHAGQIPTAHCVVDAMAEAPASALATADDSLAFIREWVLRGRAEQVARRIVRPSERALGIDEATRAAVRDMWVRTREATAVLNVNVPPFEWARRVVASNFGYHDITIVKRPRTTTHGNIVVATLRHNPST